MFPDMGMIKDAKHRQREARTWSAQLQEKIKKARNLLYIKGYSLVSQGIERLLSLFSLVPTEV